MKPTKKDLAETKEERGFINLINAFDEATNHEVSYWRMQELIEMLEYNSEVDEDWEEDPNSLAKQCPIDIRMADQITSYMPTPKEIYQEVIAFNRLFSKAKAEGKNWYPTYDKKNGWYLELR